jgi:hypothetical protein
MKLGGEATMFRGQMPDITAAQVVALVGNAIAIAIAFGIDLSTQQQNALMALAASLGAILVLSDSHLRSKRVQAHAVRTAAEIEASAPAVADGGSQNGSSVAAPEPGSLAMGTH